MMQQHMPSMINNVAVVGGTHGNEYTGVFCVKALERQLQQQDIQNRIRYPFHLSTVIGNPVAHIQNKRFVDTDLNRQFSYDALQKAKSISRSTSQNIMVEQQRALELNELLGPKQFHDDVDDDVPPKMDLIIDLHTTTTNMGVTIIVGQDDVLTTQCAAYVLQRCPFTTRILIHTHANQKERPHLSSIAKHAFTIEVGAVPQGVVRHDKVEEMQTALRLTLEFLQRWHDGQQEQLYNELIEHFDSGNVPCYRSAPAIREGEMSAKLQWPSSKDNPNFPLWIVHKSVQDRDFTQIQTGDPLFVDLDGTVIPYDGAYGSPIILMFINEGGYYYGSSGTGISVAVQDEFDLETGSLLSTNNRKMSMTRTNSNDNDNNNNDDIKKNGQQQQQPVETAATTTTTTSEL
ncbi:aspartoacylase [Nitzschia inconspicua]|uniref:Aspartoacylase n=1 Tax=Nitzschia inconspicua TaxID=303405 RepID=A0A9K3LI41_9STRA|nr:aspartoacylase [Nitzschia inconspicua]KAG7362467.1 aspartoacylase [Nitzschia inconspicua]